MCNDKKIKNTSLDKNHDKEHAVWNRRSFLQALGLAGTGSIMLGKLPVSAATQTPLSTALSMSESDRVLVIVRLKGGNDGLNTVIPNYDYDTYANLRPTIKINSANSFALSDDFRMPDYMNALEPLWGDGKMKVAHGVGYPNQNLSHFTSADLWSSAADNGTILQTGVLGRYYEGLYPDYLVNPPVSPPAIQIGSLSNLLFNGEESGYAFSVANPGQLKQIAENGTAFDMQNLPACEYGDQLRFVRSVTNTTYIYAGVIHEAYKASTNAVTYGDNSISKQLAIVARLIKGGLGTKIYMVTIDGFDTHANQPTVHKVLMSELTSAMANFYTDLAATDNWDKEVLAMTISEFGRRAAENASSGTDHGSASTMMLFGEGLNGNGFIGEHPSLSSLDNGNLKFSTDFRAIYASILEEWLCIDLAVVDATLLKTYDRANLGITCSGNLSPDEKLEFSHRPIYGDNTVFVEFKLLTAMHVKIELINMLGQNLGVVHNERHLIGTYQINLNPTQQKFTAGQYIYRIIANDKPYSKSVLFVR